MSNEIEPLFILDQTDSPLPPNAHRIQADDPIPQPEPGTCPWPIYNCRVSKYRSFDGSCNNLHRPLTGRAFTPFQRFLPPSYGDGKIRYLDVQNFIVCPVENTM